MHANRAKVELKVERMGKAKSSPESRGLWSPMAKARGRRGISDFCDVGVRLGGVYLLEIVKKNLDITTKKLYTYS